MDEKLGVWGQKCPGIYSSSGIEERGEMQLPHCPPWIRPCGTHIRFKQKENLFHVSLRPSIIMNSIENFEIPIHQNIGGHHNIG